MLVYEECFNTVIITHASLGRIFQYGRVYLHFTYSDIYICYKHSPHLMSIINVTSSMAMSFNRQAAILGAVRFRRNSVADGLIRFSIHPRLLLSPSQYNSNG